jgi:tetratricopeptide (TPR) repeat protein
MYIFYKAVVIFTIVCFSNLTHSQSTFRYKRDYNKILNKSKNSNDEISCKNLRTRFLNNDKSLTDFEVLALLIGFTAHDEYLPYDNLAIQREIYNLNIAGNFEEAVKMGKSFLDKHPYNLRGHIELAYAFQNLNLMDSSERYAYRAQRIQNAMLYSGDGKTKNTAMFALGTADSKDFVLTYLQAGIGTIGSSTDDDGNFLDVIEVKYKNGKSEYFYFNIQHASKTVFGGKAMKNKSRN